MTIYDPSRSTPEGRGNRVNFLGQNNVPELIGVPQNRSEKKIKEDRKPLLLQYTFSLDKTQENK